MSDDKPDENLDSEPSTLQDTINAFNNLPILSRLEFAANLLFDRGGGDRLSDPRDWTVVAATEIIHGAIAVLRAHPQAAQLRKPEL